ncbi:hypothetical protein [Nocardiopsis ganjiahuensis]|uniref:hypothetical protein n=1 Tax=Nocardiopsis ganjiahuensis TaxID=239984 RepID=UPI0003461817|nr:hypothetical protein [Nocardiopsis ganjiahuensis]
MTSVNSLVNIAVFGIGGAIMVAALIGLLLVVSGSSRGASPRLLTVFGAASVVLLVVLPSLSALNVLSGGGGFWVGFVTASAVAAVMYAVNVALLPTLARRQAMVSGRPGLSELRPSASVLLGGLAVCLGVGLLVTGVTAFIV